MKIRLLTQVSRIIHLLNVTRNFLWHNLSNHSIVTEFSTHKKKFSCFAYTRTFDNSADWFHVMKMHGCLGPGVQNSEFSFSTAQHNLKTMEK